MYNLREEIACATKAYYDQAREIHLTATDFFEWLSSLPTARRAALLANGFALSHAEPVLLRFCLERRGFRMWPFMAEHLSNEAFLRWADYE